MVVELQVVVWFVGVVVVWVSHWVYRWMNPKCKNGKLPPGSMGFPIIGESMHFFSPSSLYGISPFIQKRVARYGSLFRTSIVGEKMVVSTDAETNYSILHEEEKSVVVSYTESFFTIIGQDSFLDYHGMIHKYLRNLVLHLVGPDNLKTNLIAELDVSTQTNLQSLVARSLDVKQVTSAMVFKYFAKKLISCEDEEMVQKLKENYDAFTNGLISFPLNIPGTPYHKAMQARKYLLKTIKDIFYERKGVKNSMKHEHDYLDHLIEEVDKKDAILTESMAITLILTFLFAAYETSSSTITLGMKYLSDHPRVLVELKREHDAVLRNRNGKDTGITWEEYKSMTFTHMVINETVRLANIVPVIIRRALKDIQINGYTIPAGWLVMIAPPAVHLDPDNYQEPQAFNPWRWEGKALHLGSKTFMAFGGGVRLCAGADFVKLQMTIFLHYLVTKYRWEVIKDGNITREPGLNFSDGFKIKIKNKNDGDM